MKSILKILIVLVLVLSASLVLFSSDVFAVDPPWVLFDGIFSYDAGSNALTTTFSTITKIAYTDGTYTGPALFGGVEDDPLCPLVGGCGTLILGTRVGDSGVIYNSDITNMDFGGSSDGTGNIDISIIKGTDTYLTATMTRFNVDNNVAGVQLNANFDDWHISNIVTDPANTLDSKFLNDVDALSGLVLGNLFTDFNFSVGANDFTENADGTLLGTKLAVAPEPVSSILFLAGGATLALRRYRKKRSI